MNKEKFIKKLRKRLEVLENKEIEDIVSEYEGYIEEKVSSGKTEEEAVSELGDFEEIVSDLLGAYKVKPTKANADSNFNGIVNKISNGIDKFIDSLNNKSGRDILKILIEIIIVLLIIGLLKIPFAIIRDLGCNIFDNLIAPFGNIFSYIWYIIIEVSYVILAIIFFIKMLEKRYFHNISEEIVETRKEEKVEKSSTKKNKSTEIKKASKVVESHGFIDTLSNICIIFLKLLVGMVLFGILFYLIGMTVAIGFVIYLITQGVTYFGILILLIALFAGGCFFLEVGINFLFNKTLKPVAFFSKLVSIIILTGIGLTTSALEIANTEIIYEHNNKNIQTVTKEITMKQDLTLYNYDKILIDNALLDNIKIEYSYPNINGLDIKINLDNCGTGYCLHSSVNKLSWNKDILRTIINDLKDKKIYTYDYNIEKVVYISEKNYNILMKNNNGLSYNRDTYNFSEVFYLSDISPSNDKYLYLTLRKYNDEDLETVKVPLILASHLTENKFYEFTFEYNDFEPETDIKDIFNKCKIINIVPSNMSDLNNTRSIKAKWQ